MTLRPRLLLLTLAAVLAALVIGCGGGDGEGASADADTSVDQVLKDTFSGKKKVESGKLDLSLKLDVQGSSDSQLQGPISLRLSGPFQTEGKGKLPQFDIDAAFEGAGQSLEAGVISTGDKAFVNFQGTDYAVSDQVFQQFKAGYEQAQKQSADKGNQQSLATLGIDPRRWLTNPKNEGEAKVGDTDTIKITGGVDVNKLLDDVNTALEKARNLGVQGSESLPEKLTDKQKQEAADAIKDLSVEIYTGKEDTTLRRMVVNMGVDAKDSSGGGATTGTLTLDFSLLDLNEDQTIEAPSGAKPFDQLLGQLGGLGLGGAGSSGSGSSGSGSSGGASAEDLKKYSDCVTAAGSDTAKAQQCADLLSP
jgi:hypothetical protein